MATKATLFDPKSGKRIAVETGSRQASDLFGQGYKLETPTQNFQTYSATPKREITLGQGNDLYATDNTAGSRSLISGPSQLSQMVNTGGFQDTRRALDLVPAGSQGSQFSGGSSVGGSDTSGSRSLPAAAPGAPMTPAVNPAESFQFAIAQLLRQAQQANTGDEDLLKQRNQLVAARFSAVNDATPADLRVLSPDQQSALRSGDQRGLETQLSGVNTALQGRERQREESRNLAQQAQQMLKDYQADARVNRQDAQNFVDKQFQMFGSAAFGKMSPEALARIEGQAGLEPGYLSNAGKTLKQQELEAKAAQAAQTKYAPGSIGEYQFAVENGYKGSYTDYQNEDANRKARAAAITAGGLNSAQQSAAFKLADDYEKASGDLPKIISNYNKVTSAAQNPSAAGDLSLIFAYMKMLDPGSVVREGEFATAQNATGVPERIQNIWNKVVTGERLNDAQRNDFITQSKKLYDGAISQQKQIDATYTDRAFKFGVPPDLVIRNQTSYQVDGMQGGGGNQAPVSIQDIENKIGISLSPDKKQKAQDALAYYRSQGHEPSVEEISDVLGFKQPLSMGVKGSTLVSKNPDPSKVIASASGTYDFTNYATDPKWGYSVKSIINKIPSPNVFASYISNIKPQSPFANNPQPILTVAQRAGIDPKLFLAIVQHESLLGTSGIAQKNNNFSGITWNGKNGMKGSPRPASEGGYYVKYPTVEEGLMALANNINKRHLA